MAPAKENPLPEAGGSQKYQFVYLNFCIVCLDVVTVENICV